ncbi:MAG: hypothetical protein P1U46_02260 [Patescibacteria group bacterium]|nr:hypothetical protein [Patescibacteria group bacterium]
MFTNIAVLAVLTIFTYILAYFGFDIYAYGDYTYLAVISVVI